MRKILISLITGTALLTAYSPAISEESGYMGNFEGFYAGVITGGSISYNNNRLRGGVLAGNRWMLSNQFVVGAEVQIVSGFNVSNFQSQGIEFSATGYAGSIIGENTLVYGKVGLSVENYTFIPPAHFTTPVSVFPIVGIGVEFAANNQINLRAETIVELDFSPNSSSFIHGGQFNFGIIANLD